MLWLSILISAPARYSYQLRVSLCVVAVMEDSIEYTLDFKCSANTMGWIDGDK